MIRIGAAHWITRLRAGLRVSQAELAELLGVHKQTVSKWERGVAAPTHGQHEVLELLARAPDLAGASLRRPRAFDEPPPAALRLARAICAADIGQAPGQLALTSTPANVSAGSRARA